MDLQTSGSQSNSVNGTCNDGVNSWNLKWDAFMQTILAQAPTASSPVAGLESYLLTTLRVRRETDSIEKLAQGKFISNNLSRNLNFSKIPKMENKPKRERQTQLEQCTQSLHSIFRSSPLRSEG